MAHHCFSTSCWPGKEKRYLAHREELSFLTGLGVRGEMSFPSFLSPVPFSSCFPSFLSVTSFSSSNFTCPSQAPSASDSPCPHGTPFHGAPFPLHSSHLGEMLWLACLSRGPSVSFERCHTCWKIHTGMDSSLPKPGTPPTSILESRLPGRAACYIPWRWQELGVAGGGCWTGSDAAPAEGSLALGRRVAWRAHLPAPCPPPSLPWALHPEARPQASPSRCLPGLSCIQHEVPLSLPFGTLCLWSCYLVCQIALLMLSAMSWPISKQHHRMKFKQGRCSDAGLCWRDLQGKAEVKVRVSPGGSPSLPDWTLLSPTLLLWLVCPHLLCAAPFSLPLTRAFVFICSPVPSCPSLILCLCSWIGAEWHPTNDPRLPLGWGSLANTTVLRGFVVTLGGGEVCWRSGQADGIGRPDVFSLWDSGIYHWATTRVFFLTMEMHGIVNGV